MDVFATIYIFKKSIYETLYNQAKIEPLGLRKDWRL